MAHPLRPIADRLGRTVARTGVSPDALTWASLFVAALATWLLGTGRFLVAPFVFAVAASLDFLDGAVARTNGTVTAAGGYLDSLIDRYVDFLVVFGLMFALDEPRGWIVGAIALFGVLMTSGAKWRVHEVLHPTDEEWGGRDLMERTERYLLVLPLVLLQGIFDHFDPLSWDLIWVALLGLAVLSNLTVVQRIRKARRILRAHDRAAAKP